MKRKSWSIFIICIFIVTIFMSGVYAQENIIKFNTNENNIGFIYFDYNPVIYATVVNKEVEERIVTIIAEVEDENGSVIWNDSYNVTLPGYKIVKVPINTNISRFGIYSLNLTVDGVTTKQEFSISNRPRDGSVSNWCMVNDHTVKGHGVKEIERKMELFYKAGFGGIRQEYLWEGFEPAIDSFTVPQDTANMIELMDSFGMDIMGIMMGCPRYISEWNNGTLPVEDDTFKEWSKYVEYTADKTKDISTYYEVWNEYNMRDGADPENYIRLLKASYDTLHKNPKAVVCGFAAANIGDNQTEYKYSVLEWIDEVLKGGGGKYMDAVSIHCYTNRAPEDDLSTLSSRKTWLIDETRELLDKYGYGDMPIIVSEMGWSTGNTYHSDIEKAQYMIRYSAMNYGKIERLYWYVSQDKQNYDTNGNADLYENGLGIINTWDAATGCENPYGAKPAFLALSNFNAMMNGASALENFETEDGVYKYKFKDKYNNDLYIAWSVKRDAEEIEISCGEKCVTVYDIYGNIIKCDTNGETVMVELDESPVYIKLTDKPESPEKYFPNVFIDYNTGEVTISGTTAFSADNAALALIKKDAENISVSDIAYIGQSMTSLKGGYDFNFILENIDGLYTAKIGFTGMDETQLVDLEFDFSLPRFSVLSEGNVIKNMSQLTDGNEISINLENAGSVIENSDTMLLAAIYSGDSVENVLTKKIDKGSADKEIKFMVESVDKVDKIKIFFWKYGNIQPLIGVYEIN